MLLPYPQTQDPAGLLQWAQALVTALNQQQTGDVSGGSSNTGGATLAPSQAQALVPTGTPLPFVGTTVPSGFILAVGQVLLRTDYPGLFAVLGTKYNSGGEAGDEFRNLDGTGRTFAHMVANYGGAASLTLGMTHLPNAALPVTDPGHNHTWTGVAHTHTLTDPGHTHAIAAQVIQGAATVGVSGGVTNAPVGAAGALIVSSAQTGMSLGAATAGGSNAPSASGVSVTLNGGGQPIATQSPFFGGKWIIKT